MRVGGARKRRRIQETLDSQKPNGISLSDVARQLGVSRSLVCQTAHGYANNRRVLRRFLELGVRPEDLDLPEDLRAEIEHGKRKVA